MFANTQWKTYTPSVRVGKLCYHYCSRHSHLPIRDVLNDHGKSFKVEPNYETATYNWCAKCNQRSVAAAVKDGLSHILFITRYTGENGDYQGCSVIVGYYEIGEVATGVGHTAIRAKKMCFVPIDKAYEYKVNNLRWATQRINGDFLEEILNYLDMHNATDDYLREVARLKAEYNPYSAVPEGRIFIINVGANTTSPLQSPLFPDGRFEFVPIPESQPLNHHEFLTYADLRQFYAPNKALLDCFSNAPTDPQMKVHNDPEFATFTYGDHIRQKGNLDDLRTGDFLFFLARLVPYDEHFHEEQAIFALIGYLEVEERIDSLSHITPAFSRNAHVLRWKANPASFNEYAIFKGSVRSRRFRYAVPFDRRLVTEVPLLSADGQSWEWERTTDLGVIGSYTRTARMHIDLSTSKDKERAARFWRHIWEIQK
jgi:hypothetical protein